MSRERDILKNTAIYAIGNFGSKILVYVIVLIYTHYITPNELGYYDIILVTISLVLPIAMCSLDEGIYRWLIGVKDENIIEIISTCTKTIIVITSIIGCILLLLNHFFYIQYVILIILLLSSMAIYQLFLNVVRGLSNSKIYAVSGIVNSSIDLSLEFIGLVFLKMGVEVLLISKIIANLITLGYLCFKQKELRSCLKGKFNISILKSLLSYSLPLIPNSLSWWIVNSSDRYIILFFLGSVYNGIYSIANKFPTVITTITGIAYFSLQESIIKEYNSSDRDQFYSKIFEKYYTILFLIIICVIPATRLIVQWLVGIDYCEAWKFTGFLYIGAVFSALSAFLGIGYQISRETKRSVVSTVSAAILNIGINLLLINLIGLYAVSFSTMIAYIFLFGLRIKHSKKYFRLQLQWKNFVLLVFSAYISIIISYLPNILIVIFAEVIIILLVLSINRKLIFDFVGIIKKRSS